MSISCDSAAACTLPARSPSRPPSWGRDHACPVLASRRGRSTARRAAAHQPDRLVPRGRVRDIPDPRLPPRAAGWRRTGTASYRSTSPRPPCTITPRPRPAHPVERPTDTHGHEPPESLSDDRQLRRSLPHPKRNAHLTKLIFPAGVSSVAVSLLAGQDADTIEINLR